MNYILYKKLKFYTKEILKFLNITFIAFGFILGIILIKYKPMYIVNLSGKDVGYVQDKKTFQESVKTNILEYTAKNVDKVDINANPEYELKLVDRTQSTNENEILVAMQKNMKITYKYYQIALEDEILDSVDTMEDAQNLINTLIQENPNKKLNLNVIEKITEDAEDIDTNTIEVAKSNISNKLSIKDKKNNNNTVKSVVNGIKLAVTPISGKISSRYGVSSSIRRSTHTGLDIAASSGTPIKVVADGTITSACYSGSYGNLVKVNHGNGVETWYAHTSKMYVSVGQNVTAGEVIAAVGSTGNSTGSHLHLEIRINGQHVNPQNYLYN